MVRGVSPCYEGQPSADMLATSQNLLFAVYDTL